MASRHSTPDAFRHVPNNRLPAHDTKALKRRVAQLSNELIKFLEQADGFAAQSDTATMNTGAVAIGRLKKLVAFRAVRNKIFGPDLFADPAWDIMLDLAIAMAEHRRISVSSLCIAANVPTTTALRHIKSMADKGLIIIVSDQTDSRRKFVHLSEDVREAMVKFALKISW